MKKILSLIIICSFLIYPVCVWAEMKKLSDSRLKDVKAGTGSLMETVLGEHEEKIYIADIRKSLDILQSDVTGSWEKTGTFKSENGVVTIDQTVSTDRIRYDNIRIKGSENTNGSFGSIHIENAVIHIKGQLRVTYIQ
jgi:hypothetical protein